MSQYDLDIPTLLGSYEEQATLDCDLLWQSHGAYTFKSANIERLPFFYPIYQWQDFYAFSPVPLLLKKGYLAIDEQVVNYLRRSNGDVMPPHLFIDSEIRRVGRPPVLTRTIRNPDDFVNSMAAAMQKDITSIEGKNPGKTNVILCGGRDSLNLLLLKWKHPTIVYSAAPNFQLVQKFVVDNRLNFEVRELQDKPYQSLQAREIVEACCMVNLENWRWAGHLSDIAKNLNFQAVFWKGQFADAVLTDYWRSYTSSFSPIRRTTKKAYKRLARFLPRFITAAPDKLTLVDFERSIWDRGAVMQGAHMGALRSITNCLFVSGYHGPSTSKVWLSGDLPRLTRDDLRPAIGRVLAGRDVIYPSQNPSPPISAHRKDLRSVSTLVAACETLGISTRTQDDEMRKFAT